MATMSSKTKANAEAEAKSVAKGVAPLSAYLNNKSIQQRLLQRLSESKMRSFAAELVDASESNPVLKRCSPSSVTSAGLIANTIGLSLNSNLGLAYLIPYWNEKSNCYRCQFQIGYKGLTQLALASDAYSRVNVSDVKEGELVSRDRLTGELDFDWEMDEVAREKLKTAGYVAFFRLNNGFEKMLYMTNEELYAHAKKFSKSFGGKYPKSSLWHTDFEAMAKKTVLKLLLSKFGPISPKLSMAVRDDQKVDGKYVDNPSNDHEGADFQAKRSEMKNNLKKEEGGKAERIEEAEIVTDESQISEEELESIFNSCEGGYNG